jgi:hypothetical protein
MCVSVGGWVGGWVGGECVSVFVCVCADGHGTHSSTLNAFSLYHSLSPPLFPPPPLSLSLSLTHTHTHTLSLSHTHTHTHTHATRTRKVEDGKEAIGGGGQRPLVGRSPDSAFIKCVSLYRCLWL